MGLTKTVHSAILCLSNKKCESIEVRLTSVHRPWGTGIPDGEKGRTPKWIPFPERNCWSVREYLPDCHNDVERYRGYQNVPVGMFACISMDRFTCGPFFIHRNDHPELEK